MKWLYRAFNKYQMKVKEIKMNIGTVLSYINRMNANDSIRLRILKMRAYLIDGIIFCYKNTLLESV